MSVNDSAKKGDVVDLRTLDRMTTSPLRTISTKVSKCEFPSTSRSLVLASPIAPPRASDETLSETGRLLELDVEPARESGSAGEEAERVGCNSRSIELFGVLSG